MIKITEQISGQRLDKFLADSNSLKDLSRSQIQKLIEAGLINVNNLTVSSHYKLKTGDTVKIIKKNIKTAATKEAKNKTKNYRLDIIDETDEFLVINKPAGLIVHGQNNYTLADWLKEKYPKIKKVGEDQERPGIVHRLDKEVSGLMVIAKTQKSFNSLKKQFQERSIIKEYTALAYGQITKDVGVINFPIKRSPTGYKMSAIPLTVKGQPTEEGRQAETRFEIVKKLINYTLLKVKIITGRTHQIRVHLGAYGHPLVGDNIYGTSKTRLQNKKLELNRIFLIADRLSFTDLTGKQKNYKINLPPELKNFLKQIK